VVHNLKARHNISRPHIGFIAKAEYAAPESHEELNQVLAAFAERGVNALVISGGDGTIRDVATAAARHFPGTFPRIAIVPSGKTNALALDLGIPRGWTARDAIKAINAGLVEEREPVEIWRDGAACADLRGFIFGAGAYVRATALAQTTHRLGAFNGLAVGASMAWAVAQTVFSPRDNSWRRGEPMRVKPGAGDMIDRNHYLLLVSTLIRMPLRIKPFGAPRPGLKMLRVDAAPRWLLAALPVLLGGANSRWLVEAGYHRHDAEEIGVSLGSSFVLDGEAFPGGALTLRRGAPIRFVVP
jgi:hypothetical protein